MHIKLLTKKRKGIFINFRPFEKHIFIYIHFPKTTYVLGFSGGYIYKTKRNTEGFNKIVELDHEGIKDDK